MRWEQSKYWSHQLKADRHKLVELLVRIQQQLNTNGQIRPHLLPGIISVCVMYHDEVANQEDGHEDGHHQVVQQWEGPPGDVVQSCSLFLQPRVRVSRSSGHPHSSIKSPYWSRGRLHRCPAGIAQPSGFHGDMQQWGACPHCQPPERSAEMDPRRGQWTADGRLQRKLTGTLAARKRPWCHWNSQSWGDWGGAQVLDRRLWARLVWSQDLHAGSV